MLNKKFVGLLFAGICLFCLRSRAQSSNEILSYIERYKDLAIAEMQRTGIPAAITLAQGIHETEAGTSELVRKSNNHFGIKCKDNWTGESVFHDDDARGECFRKYSAPEDSYRDHSDFLRSRSNYASLFQIDPTDYQAWAYGLKKAGYATNPKYPQILIKLIEDYHLEDFTLIAMGKKELKDDLATSSRYEPAGTKKEATLTAERVNPDPNPTTNQEQKPVAIPAVAKKTYPDGEFKLNETRVVFVKKGTSYLTIAQQYEIPLSRIFEFNDLQPKEVTADDELVFIQRKRKTGEHEFHVTQPGESLQDISQSEAIRLETLLEYNNLGANMQPAVGETLYLRSKSSSAPRLASKNSVVGR